MTAESPGRRPLPFAAALCAITVFAAALRAWGLAAQPGLGDDWSAGLSAITFVERGEIGEPVCQVKLGPSSQTSPLAEGSLNSSES